MRLETLKLWNFRKYGTGGDELNLNTPDLIVSFTQGLNVLIGENDSGKTAIIDAIKLLLDTHSSEWNKIDHDDFHKGTKKLRIECKFVHLIDNEAKNYIEWLGIEGDEEELYLKVFLSASQDDNGKILPYDIRAGADNEGSRLDSEARDYLRTTYLKPLRDAESELVARRNSRLSQILSGHKAFKGKEKDHKFKTLAKCWDCLFKKYFDNEHRAKGCEIGPCPYEGRFHFTSSDKSEGETIQSGLNNTVNSFLGDEDYQANFSVLNKKLRNLLEQFELSFGEIKIGLGNHNLLFMAAELLNLERDKWSGVNVVLIEELEAHLHPQAQMRVVEYLQDLASSSKGKDIQIILTTHSPNLASKVKLENVIICQGKQVFSLGKDDTELEPDDHVFLEKFLDVTKSNLFFAKGIIFVEGWSEEILLPALAKKVGIDLTSKGVSIVNVAHNEFLRYSKIFRRKDGQEMNVPVAIVTDVDVTQYEQTRIEEQAEGAEPTGSQRVSYEYKLREPETVEAECNTNIDNLKKEYNSGKIKVFPSPVWTLEYCLYESQSLSGKFQEIVKGVYHKIGNDGDFEKDLASSCCGKDIL